MDPDKLIQELADELERVLQYKCLYRPDPGDFELVTKARHYLKTKSQQKHPS